MVWIESHDTLGGHPKTRKLAHLLGVSKPAAVGHLHYLWWWAVNYAPDGDLSRHDQLDIAIGAEWDGDPGEFVEALVTVGFLDRDVDDTLVIHDWHDYAGKLIERRKANAERMRKARASGEQGTSAAQDEDVPARASHVQGTQRARAERPNRTVPNQTEPDRTEENSRAHARGGAHAPASSPSDIPPEASPMPRTPRQQQSDARHARRMALFAAFCRGIGLDPDAEEAAVYGDRAHRELKPVQDKPVPSPAEMEACTRYLAAQTWRDEPPKIPQVLGSYAGWVAKGRPAEPEPKSGTITPLQTTNRRQGGWSAQDYADYAHELKRQGQ